MTVSRNRDVRLLVLGLSATWAAFSSTACDSAGFKRAYMALDSEGERRRDVFYTDSEGIFCVVEMASGREDVTVRGSLRGTHAYLPPRGHAVPRVWQVGVEEEAPGSGENITVSFEWQKAAQDLPYAAGVYVCDLFLEDELEESVSFEVRYPECPVAALVSGLVCDGFVLPGARCAGAFAGETCVCDDGVWQC